jgi:hypothetical protein
MHSTLFIGSDALIVLDSFRDVLNDSAYVNDATATADLTLSTDSTAIASLGLTYEAASDGKYEGTIAASVTTLLTANTLYTIRATAVKDGATFYAELDAEAKVKTFT